MSDNEIFNFQEVLVFLGGLDVGESNILERKRRRYLVVRIKNKEDK